jgi:hypothetical protein
MRHDDEAGTFTARQSGLVGHEILNPAGEVIAWANGHWAAKIVASLNVALEKDSCGEHVTPTADVETPSRRCGASWHEQADCVRLDPDDDLVETVLIEQNSGLIDQDDGAHTLPIRISMASGRLRVAARGYGNGDMADGYGHPVCIEVYDGELRILAFPNIFDECPVSLSLEGAREERRPPE